MASVDGSRFYLAGSEQVLQHSCGPCKVDREETEATFFCEVCSVYLCAHCRDDHKKFNATKTHSVVSAHWVSSQGLTVVKGAFAILGGCNQKHAVKLYCENNAQVICPAYGTTKHRNCKICPIIKRQSSQRHKGETLKK